MIISSAAVLQPLPHAGGWRRRLQTLRAAEVDFFLQITRNHRTADHTPSGAVVSQTSSMFLHPQQYQLLSDACQILFVTFWTFITPNFSLYLLLIPCLPALHVHEYILCVMWEKHKGKWFSTAAPTLLHPTEMFLPTELLNQYQSAELLLLSCFTVSN